MFFFFIESQGICLKEIDNNKRIFLITFSSGFDQYSNRTAADFYFSIDDHYQQIFAPDWSDGRFAFVNKIPNPYGTWHDGALDHTDGDKDGYMYLICFTENNPPLFNKTINNLCIGQSYKFSASLANAERLLGSIEPNVRFEIRSTKNSGQLLAEFSTGNISRYKTITWWECGISFNASESSVVLLIISNTGGGAGNDLIIDDIELQVSLTTNSSYCIPG